MVYPGSMPRDVDILNPEKNTMLAFGALISAAFGSGTYVFGLGGSQTTVPSMTIDVGAGSIIALENVDNTAFGSLAADTSDTVMKQGINIGATPLTMSAPTTAGQTVNYLVEASFSETDTGATVLGYVDAAVPSQPFNGPNNTGTSQNTQRIQRVNLVAKAGIAAATGIQVTPGADSGFVPVLVVSIPYGTTAITNAMISVHPSAPFLPTIPQLQATAQAQSGTVGSSRNLTMNVAAASATATLAADEIIVATALGGASYRLKSFSQNINLATTGAGGMDTGVAPVSGYVAIYAIYNPLTQAAALLAVNATSSVAPMVYGGASMPAGYTASALVSVWQTNASRQLFIGYQSERSIQILNISALTTSTAQTSITALSISSIVPPNAKTISGSVSISGSSSFNGNLQLYATAIGVGQIQINGNSSAGGGSIGSYSNFPITTSQVVYYQYLVTISPANLSMYISGYTI